MNSGTKLGNTKWLQALIYLVLQLKPNRHE